MLDVLIIGAGPVGATLALLLRESGKSVLLLEARDTPSTEQRTLALSYASKLLLDKTGVWSDIKHATAITTIHVSHRGGFGRTKISADDANVPALGYVVRYADLQTALDAGLNALTVKRGALVQTIDECGSVTYAQQGAQQGAQHVIEAKLVVMADGGANLDKVASIKTSERNYGETALLGYVTTDQAHGAVAYERFSATGPAALLPHGEGYSMVWVDKPDAIARLLLLDAQTFLGELQHHFGRRAGRFLTVDKRRSFPLKLRLAEPRVAGRVVVVGNAAQALHPVAGQGFNLGLRDAQDLADLISISSDAGDAQMLMRYMATREQDADATVGFTNFLVKAFASDVPHLRMPRGLGLAALDILPFARKRLAQRMIFGSR